MTRVFNFSAGPAALPEPVLRRLEDAVLWAIRRDGNTAL